MWDDIFFQGVHHQTVAWMGSRLKLLINNRSTGTSGSIWALYKVRNVLKHVRVGPTTCRDASEFRGRPVPSSDFM
jgi:hypothetical protein